MRFQQVKEVIEWAVDTHARLAEQFAALSRGAGDERLKMASSYLAERERRMEEALTQYLDEDSQYRNALETWFNDGSQFPHPEVVDELTKSAPETTDDLLATALSIHKTLSEMYTRRAEAARVDSERALFKALVAGHNSEVRRIVRDFGRLEML